jgi:3-oxoacyl-[acyl-carrier-protein] synthase-3
MKQVYINEVEYFLPSIKENNLKFLNQIGKNKIVSKKIVRKIGIKNRRVAEKNIYSNDLAVKSAKKVLKKLNRKSIDFLIYCTQTPDYLIPTNACILQDQLKLKKQIGAFDINLGCSGYVYSLSIAKSLIISGQANNILLITSDTYSKFIKKDDLSTRLIFSDSSTSTLISSKKKKNSYKILNSTYGTDGSGYKDFILKNFGTKFRNNTTNDGNYIKMNGASIFDFTLKEIPAAINFFLKKNNLKLNKIDHFIFHQANEFIIENLQKKMKILKKKVIIDVKDIGNTVSGTIPIVLKKHKNNIKKGSYILLVGFGVGLSWGITLIKKN